MIFGNWGFPELGIKGAAIATVISASFSLLAYLVLLSRRAYDQRYHTLRGWRFKSFLFVRLMRFGLPSGVQFFLDVAGFTVFLLLVGRLGTNALAATNIAFNINSLAFMPMIGFGIAVSVLVGQHLGKDHPDLAVKSAYSGFHLTFLYMGTVAALYVLVPDLFLRPFAAQADVERFCCSGRCRAFCDYSGDDRDSSPLCSSVLPIRYYEHNFRFRNQRGGRYTLCYVHDSCCILTGAGNSKLCSTGAFPCGDLCGLDNCFYLHQRIRNCVFVPFPGRKMEVHAGDRGSFAFLAPSITGSSYN